MKNKTSLPRRVMVTLVSLMICGCSGGSSSPPTFIVRGLVTLDGSPLTEASILFEDQLGKDRSGFSSVQDGIFETEVTSGPKLVKITAIRTVPDKMVESADGTSLEPAREQYLPAKYNLKTELIANVSESDQNELTFDLISH